MATGSVSITITIPVTNANDPNFVGRGIAKQMLEQAIQGVGDGKSTSGNLTYPGGSAAQ
jgi:hypothetical protein